MAHKIMIVDDDPHVIESLGSILRDAGYQVISMEDGETALATAQTELPSLIILDLMMPRIFARPSRTTQRRNTFPSLC
jgi:DNA-binding response OmpR family regulator